MPVEKTGALKALGTVVHTAYDGYVTESTFAVDASKPPLCWRTQVAGKGLSASARASPASASRRRRANSTPTRAARASRATSPAF